MTRSRRKQPDSIDARGTGEQREAVAQEWLAYCALEYSKKHNPVYAWRAISLCLSGGLPLPAWATGYLLDAAFKISQLSGTAVPQKGNIDRAIAAALGMRGRGRFNPFREPSQTGHELSIAMQVYQCQTKNRNAQRSGMVGEGDYKWDAIFREVADVHHLTCEHCTKKISVGQVEKCWRKHAPTVIPKHLINQAKSKKLDDILR